MMIRRLAKEPFAHFLLLGLAIFLADRWLNRSAEQERHDREDRIVIDQEDYDHLKTLWQIQWKREPAPGDIQALIERYVRQEVFYREALRMKLDHNDEIIKKRLAQKMEAVANDLARLMQPPTDEQLKTFFRSRKDLFQLPQAFAFQQVLFLADETKSGNQLEEVLGALRAGEEMPAERSNKLSVPNEWELTSVDRLENAFGGGFSKSLDELPVQQWSGPIRSGFGLHLVFIETKQGPRLPDFAEVKDYVAREYEYQSELEAQDRVYQELLAKYRVSITADNVPDQVRTSLEMK